ncbi:hypothetical protein ACLECX_11605 [Lonsdalea quercina]
MARISQYLSRRFASLQWFSTTPAFKERLRTAFLWMFRQASQTQ